MLKSFFVALTESEHAQAALHYACHLAALAQGKVHIGHIIEIPFEPAIATGLTAGSLEYMATIPPMQSTEEINAYRKEREAYAEGLFAQARAVCERHGVACQTHCLMGYLEEEILGQARAVDLVVIGQSDVEKDRKKVGRVTESIVRGSPQPVLIVTAPFAPPSDLIILYNGDDRALHALGVGAELARLFGVPLHLVTVTASEEEGEIVGQRASQYLSDHDVEFENHLIASMESPDRMLVDLLNSKPQALALMGAFGEWRVKEWITGSTTRTILHETRNPLMLFRC